LTNQPDKMAKIILVLVALVACLAWLAAPEGAWARSSSHRVHQKGSWKKSRGSKRRG
jgi:hypothetical protein